jgi:hypothetical protein
MSTPQPISVGSRAESPAAAILAAKRQQPFAEDGSGEVYFRSDYHHRQIAAAILARLAKGHHFLLASGDPAADGELLEHALNDAGGGRYRATLLRSHAAMDFGALVRSCNRRLSLRQEADSDGLWALLSYLMAEVRKGVRRILVLEDAETLDAACFDELLRFARLDEPHVVPVVLLAGPGLADRLAAGELAFLRSAITDRIAVDRLEPEEVGAFIRCQLNALATDEEEALFCAEAVERIAAKAGGDPATVNRLARDLLAAARGETRPVEPAAPDVEVPEVALPKEAEPAPSLAAAPLVLTEPLAAPLAVEGEPSLENHPPPLPPPQGGRGIASGARFAGPKSFLRALRASVVKSRGRRVHLASPVAIGLYVLAAAVSGLGLVHWFNPRAAHAPSVALTSPAALPAHAPPAPRAVLPEKPSAPAPAPAMAAAAPAAAAIEPAAGPVVAAAPKTPAVAEPAPHAPVPGTGNAAPQSAPAASPRPAAKPIAEAALPEGKPAAPVTKPVSEAALPDQRPTTHAVAAAPRTKPAAAPDPATLMMVERGDALLMSGDIVSARSFFARAAAAGDADAEFGLAKSYDPLFLHEIGVRGVGGDVATALGWYRRAAAAGSRAAAAELRQLGATTSPRSIPEERR